MHLSNEELAVAHQQGDHEASAELFSQNMGLLTRWAKAIQQQYGLDCVVDDLVQEGGITLLDAAGKYDPTRGVKLMSFAGDAVQQAMRSCASSMGSVVDVPISRLQQIRAVRYWALQAPSEWSREQTEMWVAEKLELSLAATRRLLKQGEDLLTYEPLEEQTNMPPAYGDPEGIYEEKLLSEHLSRLIGTALTVREQTLVRHYFGLGAETSGGMTLEELAVHLNYNGPSGAQKALDGAIKKLRDNFDSGDYGKWCAACWLVAWQKRHLRL